VPASPDGGRIAHAGGVDAVNTDRPVLQIDGRASGEDVAIGS
jgi:hypothetical protein